MCWRPKERPNIWLRSSCGRSQSGKRGPSTTSPCEAGSVNWWDRFRCLDRVGRREFDLGSCLEAAQKKTRRKHDGFVADDTLFGKTTMQIEPLRDPVWPAYWLFLPRSWYSRLGRRGPGWLYQGSRSPSCSE